MKCLGIEIAGKRLILVQVDPALDPLSIEQASSRELPGPGAGESLRAALGEERVTARVAHLVLSEANAVHRVLQLPPMGANERRLFLDREMSREIGGAALVDHAVLRQVDGTPRKDEVLVAAVPSAEANAVLEATLAARLAPRLVTTTPLALIRAAEVLSPESFERPVAVVHWGFRGLTVSVADEGALKFTREVPHLTVPGLDPREWFATEFQRSIRQYMQTVKGPAVGTIVVGSVDARFEATLPEVETRLALTVVNLNEAMRAILPEDHAETADTVAGAFILAFGAAMLPAKDGVNLLPPSILARQRLAFLKRGAGVAAALLLVSLGYSAWGAAQEAATYRKAVARLAAEKQTRQAEAAQLEQIKQERDKQYQRIRLLTGDPLGGPPLAEVFKEISRVAPDQLRLERVAVGRDGPTVTIRMSGRLESADLADAQSQFNRLYFGLQGSPLFSDVIFNPPSTAKVIIQQGSSPSVEGRTARDFQGRAEAGQQREGVAGQGKKLAFELELRLRPVK